MQHVTSAAEDGRGTSEDEQPQKRKNYGSSSAAAPPVKRAKESTAIPLVIADAARSLSPGWFILRMLGASAATVAAYIGVSKYYSPTHAHWHLRHNPHEGLEPSPATRHGNFYEDTDVRMFERWSGNKVLHSPFRVSGRFGWIRATPDGFILDDVLQQPPGPALLECKCPFNAMYKPPPMQYLVQQFFQMFVYQIRVSYLSVWHPSGAMRVWRVRWDDDVWYWILVRLELFWTMLKYDLPVDSTVLPWVVQEADDYVKFYAGTCAADVVGRGRVPRTPWELQRERVRIARMSRISPNDIPPPVPVELMRWDEALETANNMLVRLTEGVEESLQDVDVS